MFKSLIFNGKNIEGVDKHTLIDSEFEEIFYSNFDLVDNIIRCYKQRNLNVAANLALFLKFRSESIPNFFPVEHLIKDYCKTYVSKNFAKYKEDIEKYLILI